MLYYWNKDNFEGLKSVGEYYATKPEFRYFASYCLLKEQGLRKQALKKIDDFVRSLKKQPIETQRTIALEIAHLHHQHQFSIHQLVVHPLEIYLKNLFLSWLEEDSFNAKCLRWLGFYTGDITYFERAIKVDPIDEISVLNIIRSHLNSVDYQTHHLSESQLLGELEEVESSITEAKKLASLINEENRSGSIYENISYYESLINSWKSYREIKTEETFPQWCESQGKQFNFWSIVYYDG